jgi:hypothetical protein
LRKSKTRNKKNHARNKKKPTSSSKRKKAHFKKVTRLTSHLTKTAARFHLKALRPDANPRTRCDAFLTFKNTVKDGLAQHSCTALAMQDCPILPASVPTFVNKSLAAFIHVHVTTNLKNLTSSVPRGDGLGLLTRLQTMNVSATPADRTRALQQLCKLQMRNKEAIINFVSRFHNQIQVLSNATINPQDMPTDKELSTFFVDKLRANVSITSDARHVFSTAVPEQGFPETQTVLDLEFSEGIVVFLRWEAMVARASCSES